MLYIKNIYNLLKVFINLIVSVYYYSLKREEDLLHYSLSYNNFKSLILCVFVDLEEVRIGDGQEEIEDPANRRERSKG